MPTVRESVLSLFYTTNYIKGYLGDGILIGDAETYLPFSTTNWFVTQSPSQGDSYHTVSIYAVPAHKAKKHLYRYQKNFASEVYHVNEATEVRSTGMRSYLYLLPKRYLRDEDHEAKVKYQVSIESSDEHPEPLGRTVFWYQNVDAFSDFLDGEPSSEHRASGCSCLYAGTVEESCRGQDHNCKRTVGCPELCSTDAPYFTAKNSSYNYFSIVAPRESLVQYNISVDMFFYNPNKLEKYHKCTIRGMDSCSFHTTGYALFHEERHLVIAYIHPTSVPSFFTTQLFISSEVKLDYVKSVALMIILVLIVIIKHCFQGTFTCCS